MLVLTRKLLESIRVRDNVVVTVLEIRGKVVRLGIDSPRSMPVHYAEVDENLSRVPCWPPAPSEISDIPKTHNRASGRDFPKTICPQCQSILILGATTCDCGHVFAIKGGPSTGNGDSL